MLICFLSLISTHPYPLGDTEICVYSTKSDVCVVGSPIRDTDLTSSHINDATQIMIYEPVTINVNSVYSDNSVVISKSKFTFQSQGSRINLQASNEIQYLEVDEALGRYIIGNCIVATLKAPIDYLKQGNSKVNEKLILTGIYVTSNTQNDISEHISFGNSAVICFVIECQDDYFTHVVCVMGKEIYANKCSIIISKELIPTMSFELKISSKQKTLKMHQVGLGENSGSIVFLTSSLYEIWFDSSFLTVPAGKVKIDDSSNMNLFYVGNSHEFIEKKNLQMFPSHYFSIPASEICFYASDESKCPEEAYKSTIEKYLVQEEYMKYAYFFEKVIIAESITFPVNEFYPSDYRCVDLVPEKYIIHSEAILSLKWTESLFQDVTLSLGIDKIEFVDTLHINNKLVVIPEILEKGTFNFKYELIDRMVYNHIELTVLGINPVASAEYDCLHQVTFTDESPKPERPFTIYLDLSLENKESSEPVEVTIGDKIKVGNATLDFSKGKERMAKVMIQREEVAPLTLSLADSYKNPIVIKNEQAEKITFDQSFDMSLPDYMVSFEPEPTNPDFLIFSYLVSLPFIKNNYQCVCLPQYPITDTICLHQHIYDLTCPEKVPIVYDKDIDYLLNKVQFDKLTKIHVSGKPELDVEKWFGKTVVMSSDRFSFMSEQAKLTLTWSNQFVSDDVTINCKNIDTINMSTLRLKIDAEVFSSFSDSFIAQELITVTNVDLLNSDQILSKGECYEGRLRLEAKTSSGAKEPQGIEIVVKSDQIYFGETHFYFLYNVIPTEFVIPDEMIEIINLSQDLQKNDNLITVDFKGKDVYFDETFNESFTEPIVTIKTTSPKLTIHTNMSDPKFFRVEGDTEVELDVLVSSVSPTITESPESEPPADGLEAWAIAVIVIVAALVVAGIVLAIIFVVRRKKLDSGITLA